MSFVALLASVALGSAFLVAGGSKIAAGHGWPDQARGLGAPTFVIPLLPWIEIVLGAVLIVQLAPLVASGLALAMLVAFTGLIVLRLSEGRHPPCACFGAWSATPIGWGHVARNAVLAALAIIAIASEL